MTAFRRETPQRPSCRIALVTGVSKPLPPCHALRIVLLRGHLWDAGSHGGTASPRRRLKCFENRILTHLDPQDPYGFYSMKLKHGIPRKGSWAWGLRGREGRGPQPQPQRGPDASHATRAADRDGLRERVGRTAPEPRESRPGAPRATPGVQTGRPRRDSEAQHHLAPPRPRAPRGDARVGAHLCPAP